MCIDISLPEPGTEGQHRLCRLIISNIPITSDPDKHTNMLVWQPVFLIVSICKLPLIYFTKVILNNYAVIECHDHHMTTFNSFYNNVIIYSILFTSAFFLYNGKPFYELQNGVSENERLKVLICSLIYYKLQSSVH